VDYIRKCELPFAGLDLFEGLYSDESFSFIVQESSYWDYKPNIPQQVDRYFAGLLRLVCAFHNTYGGLIFLEVDDQTRKLTGIGGNFSIENFNLSSTKNCRARSNASGVRIICFQIPIH